MSKVEYNNNFVGVHERVNEAIIVNIPFFYDMLRFLVCAILFWQGKILNFMRIVCV